MEQVILEEGREREREIIINSTFQSTQTGIWEAQKEYITWTIFLIQFLCQCYLCSKQKDKAHDFIFSIAGIRWNK